MLNRAHSIKFHLFPALEAHTSPALRQILWKICINLFIIQTSILLSEVAENFEVSLTLSTRLNYVTFCGPF